MTTYADLEIGLHHRDADRYSVELRFSDPESDGEVRLTGEVPPLAQFDFGRLRELQVDDEAYGQLLSQGLFGDSSVATAFAQARRLGTYPCACGFSWDQARPNCIICAGRRCATPRTVRTCSPGRKSCSLAT